ncbi:HipA domain-containing protein [Candidatus Sulfidibacterium hydrothermale]|uniref:HipA domain-containing protein n=1 Tax=Candidatus Sulfidibacterium hydrothermale TaxID=2875962 RepID=UPI001F0A4DDE|nr:HipA domain-containing protein [Candidatus Sulfidibacterium hydrothermale]UBM61291.1 HipA domain-containing protein [Candidatus Sulfidibacterium hydrothermale]
MENKCLYCYNKLNDALDFHPRCIKTFFGSTRAPLLPYTIDQMADLAKNVVQRSISVPGVQPKLSLSLIKAVGKKESRLTVVGALDGNYILKPPHPNYPEMPQNEHLTMRMAEVFGIKVVPSSLIRLKSGELSYITKRIDRTDGGEKIHMIDMFQITEAFDKYKSSMEKIGKAIESYSENPLLDKLFFFELTVFSFLTGNNDMHLKNFSMIKTDFGWVLSPAYDLLNATILNPDDDEELALTLEGRKKKLQRKHFEHFGYDLGLSTKQTNGVFKRFYKNKESAYKLIGQSFLSDDMKNRYWHLMEKRYDILSG